MTGLPQIWILTLSLLNLTWPNFCIHAYTRPRPRRTSHDMLPMPLIVYYILSTQYIIVSRPHSIQYKIDLQLCSAPWRSVDNCGFQMYSLVLQTRPFPFHSTKWLSVLVTYWKQSGLWNRKARGSHLYVACWSICNWDQDFWLAKSVLDWLIVPSKALDHLIFFYGSKVRLQLCILVPLLQFGGDPDPLVGSQRGLWSLDSQLQMLLHRSHKWLYP